MQTILAAALLTLVTSASTYAQCTDADRKKLEEFDKAWSDAGVRGDRAFLQNVYADNFMGLGPGGTLAKAQTIDNTLRDAERNKANPEGASKTTFDHYIIACTPNSATITHRNTFTEKADGKEETFFSRSVHVLEKRGDRWQVVSNAGHPLNDAGILLYMERDWNDASRKRDAAWFERNYASDASDVSSRTGEIHSKAEEIASMKNDKSVMESLELSDLDVRIEGTAAIVTGVNHVKGRDEQGKAFDRRVRFTDTFVKRDGRWQVWATQGTPVQSQERR
ncbi:MAG: nuclear transport factor 2 family protein [Gemmatimonadaceae bacterium]